MLPACFPYFSQMYFPNEHINGSPCAKPSHTPSPMVVKTPNRSLPNRENSSLLAQTGEIGKICPKIGQQIGPKKCQQMLEKIEKSVVQMSYLSVPSRGKLILDIFWEKTHFSIFFWTIFWTRRQNPDLKVLTQIFS